MLGRRTVLVDGLELIVLKVFLLGIGGIGREKTVRLLVGLLLFV